MKKEKIFVIIIMCLFIGSAFLGIPDNRRPLEETVEPIVKEPIGLEVPESPQTKTVPTGWTIGESVKTDIEFNSQIPDILESQLQIKYSTISHYEYHYWDLVNNLYLNDGSKGEFVIVCDGTSSIEKFDLLFKLYCGGAGIFYFEYYAFFDTTGITYTGDTIDSTLTVTNSMLDSLGYLNLRFELFYFDSTDSTVELFYTNVNSGVETALGESDDSVGPSAIERIKIYIDELKFIRNTIVNNIRSSYQYASESVIIHSVIIPSVPHAKEINIYCPTEWSYSSVNPSATVTNSGSDFTITSPTEMEYIIMFNSNSSYFLAIEEKSSEYFSNIGFEDGLYLDDISENVGYEWDTIEIATDIVFEGYHSLMLEHTTISTTILTIDALIGRVRGFYFQMAIYYETVSAAEHLNIYYYDGSSWTSIDLDQTIINRWQIVQIYVDDNEYCGGEEQFRIDAQSATYQGKVFIDAIKIFEFSTEISTTDLDEYKISSTFISWDGYQNPSYEPSNYNLTLIDRTVQTTITSVNTSDLSYEYSASLLQKEYELFIDAYSTLDTTFCNSSFYFTPEYSYNIDYPDQELSDSWDFSEGDKEGWSPYSYVSDVVENGYWEKESTTAYSKYYIQNIESFDETIYTEIVFRVWSNVSQTLHLNQKTGGMWGTTRGETHHVITANTWTVFTTTIISVYDIDCLILNTDSSATAKKIRIDFIRIVQVEELSFFTTDTTITLDSESSALVNKVYSDDQCLGNYTEPGIVPLNGTLSVNHNITRVPFARAGVSKAFLYSETTQYTYLISIASNYFTSLRVSIDAAGGLLYVGYLTYWGNTTIRVSDNGSWLGTAQNEGNTIWSFDETNYGLHNFTLYFYNGGDTWVSFSTSVTIVEPDLTVLALSYYEKHYDADAGHIYINYETTWGNTTIRVSDNSSWLGVAVSGEELSIWTTNSDYGLHNITVIIYSNAVEWFTDIFTFTYNQPSQIWKEVLFRFTSSITGATIDSEKYLRIFIDDQLVSAGTVTYLENFNITIFDNFNNELYTSTNTAYATIIDIGLALRLINFTNPNAVACRYEIWKGSYDQSLIIASLATESYYLFDSNYTLIAEALDPHFQDNIQYILTDSIFTVEIGMATISLILNTYEETDFLMSFTFTSSYTGATIDSEIYLIIFLNGTKIDSSVNVWSKDNFTLQVYDNFDNILYDLTISYSRVVALTLAMRQFTFTNMEQEATTIDIQQSGSDGLLFFPLAIAGTIPVWLTDGSYTVTHSPRDPDKETNVLWTSKSYNFDCSISSQTLSMYLDQFEIIDAPTDFMSSIREYFQENMNMMIVVLVTLVIVAIIVIVSTVVIVQKVSELILLMKKKKN